MRSPKSSVTFVAEKNNSSKAEQTAVFLPLPIPQTSAMGTTQLLTGMLYDHDVGKHTLSVTESVGGEFMALLYCFLVPTPPRVLTDCFMALCKANLVLSMPL